MRIEGGAAVGWDDQSQDSSTTTVQLGENSLAQVAARLGISAGDLQNANPQIGNANALTAGTEVRIPSAKTEGSIASETVNEAPADSTSLASSKRMESNVDALIARTALSAAWDGKAADAAA